MARLITMCWCPCSEYRHDADEVNQTAFLRGGL
jgi:hypothetical protein